MSRQSGIDAVVELRDISKTYEGAETSLRGTKLEWRGPALWARNLARSVRLTTNNAPPVTAPRDVSLAIAPGEVFGLVGPNGSGKTTLIKILAGLVRPSAGDGQVAGAPLSHPDEIRRRVSYVSTTGWMGLEWPLTAEENVRYFAALCGMPPGLVRVRAEEALRAVELWPDRNKHPSELSNGMRQRVILARALLFRTPLVLLDEPTVGLDPVTTRAVLHLIRERLRERGQTVLLTDHQSAEMAAVADRIAVLHEGAIVMSDTPDELLRRLSHLTVIEIHTEDMDLPPEPPPTLIEAVQQAERPGALGMRVWRLHAHKCPEALETALDWVAQPSGRVVFLVESAPTFQDVLALSGSRAEPDSLRPVEQTAAL